MRYFGRFFRIRLQRTNNIDPIECVEVIEVDNVILKILCAEHEVPDQLGIRSNADAQGILDRSH